VLRFLGLNSEIRDQWVKKALFARGEGKLVPTSIGQFSPGQIGGPNATQGFEGTSFINPLDFILMIEGVTLFSGSVSRKLESSNRTKSAFPFTVFSSSVGNTMDSVKDAKKARGEMWLPLWSRFAGLAEIVQVLAEGRAEINGKQVSYGLQFARAATSLGVDRGISAFVRYAFLQRSGKNYIATALGRFDVRARPDVDLLRDADAWLDRFRRTASGDKAPPRFKSALRRIESAIFAFCQFGGVTRFGEILCAFGNAERELARGERFREDVRVQPVSGLSLEWLRAADDKSMEFELALALAGIHDHEKKVGPIRANIEAVSFERRRPDWKKNGFSEVWNNASLSMNLLAVLERRVIDAEKLGCKDLPLLSPYKASVDAVSAYIAGDVDDRRIEELLWGMVLVNHSKLSGEPRSPGRSEKEHGDAESLAVMPRSYALLKLLFLSGALVTGNGTINVRPEPSIMSLLRAGRTAGACAIASRRLRASGLTTMTHRKGAEPFNELDWQTDAVDSMRLGAALLFPISASSVDSLRKMVVRPSHKYLSR
jgi:CRISPR-associated protein Csx17